MCSPISLDLKEMAMHVTTDPDHKFDLALQLDNLDVALEIARTLPELESTAKWKALGDRGLAVWRLDLAKESFEKAGDLHSLMLLLLSIGDRKGLKDVAVKAGKVAYVIPQLLTLMPSIL
jgi:coatomer subunit beta'